MTCKRSKPAFESMKGLLCNQNVRSVFTAMSIKTLGDLEDVLEDETTRERLECFARIGPVTIEAFSMMLYGTKDGYLVPRPGEMSHVALAAGGSVATACSRQLELVQTGESRFNLRTKIGGMDIKTVPQNGIGYISCQICRRFILSQIVRQLHQLGFSEIPLDRLEEQLAGINGMAEEGAE